MKRTFRASVWSLKKGVQRSKRDGCEEKPGQRGGRSSGSGVFWSSSGGYTFVLTILMDIQVMFVFLCVNRYIDYSCLLETQVVRIFFYYLDGL